VVTVRLKNSGHAPARHATVQSTLFFEKAGEISQRCPADVKPSNAAWGPASRSVIGINATKDVVARSFQVLDDKGVSQLETGQVWFYVYVITSYEGSGRRYVTEYYSRYDFHAKTLLECSTHNDAT